MKKTIALLLLGFMSLTACTVDDTPPENDGNIAETPINEPSETPEETPPDNSEEDTLVVADYKEYLKTAADPAAAKEAMETLMKSSSLKTRDALLSQYLSFLRTYQFMGMEPFRGDFQKLEPYFDPGARILSATITDAALKDLLNRFADMGYKFIQLEGSVEPIIDFRFVENYKDMVSNEMLDYGKFKAQESDEIWAADAGIVITLEELGRRIYSAETYLETYPDAREKATVISDLRNYLHGYLGGLPNTPVVSEGRFDSSFISAYKKFLKDYPDSHTAKVLKAYHEELMVGNGMAPYVEHDPLTTRAFMDRVTVMAENVVGEFGPVAAEKTYRMAEADLNLRSEPKISGEILWVIPEGTLVRADMEWNGWVRVEASDWSGYTRENLLKELLINPNMQRMTRANLNLREEPSLESRVLLVIPAQTLLEVEEHDADWGKTTYAGLSGYVSLSYLLVP